MSNCIRYVYRKKSNFIFSHMGIRGWKTDQWSLTFLELKFQILSDMFIENYTLKFLNVCETYHTCYLGMD